MRSLKILFSSLFLLFGIACLAFSQQNPSVIVVSVQKVSTLAQFEQIKDDLHSSDPGSAEKASFIAFESPDDISEHLLFQLRAKKMLPEKVFLIGEHPLFKENFLLMVDIRDETWKTLDQDN